MRLVVGPNAIGGETTDRRVGAASSPALALLSGYDPTDRMLVPDDLPTLVNDAPGGAGTIPWQIPFAFVNSAGHTLVLFRDSQSRLNILDTTIPEPNSYLLAGSLATFTWDAAGGYPNRVIPSGTPVVAAGDKFQFQQATGALAANTDYWIVSTQTSPLSFYVAATKGGTPLAISESGTGTFRTYPGPVIPISSSDNDSVPVRVNGLVVFPATDDIWCVEPDALGTYPNCVRPLGFHSPADYDAASIVKVTQGPDLVTSDANRPSAGQLFSTTVKGGAGNHWRARSVVAGSGIPMCWVEGNPANEVGVGDSEGTGVGGYEGWAGLVFGVAYPSSGPELIPASTMCFTLDLTSSPGFPLDVSQWPAMVFDFALRFKGTDPNSVIGPSGKLLNAGGESGFELVFFSDIYSTQEICRYTIPTLRSDGGVSRIYINNSNMATLFPGNTTVRGIGIATAINFKQAPANPTTTDLYSQSTIYSQYTLYVYGGAAAPYTPTSGAANWWNFKSNLLVPPCCWTDSPWFDLLPTVASSTSAGSAQGTSAIVLESFTQDFNEVTPARPQVKYVYGFFGKDQLSSAEPNPMVSNPSAELPAPYMADPWRTISLEVDLPSLAGATVLTQYGSYVLAAVIYRDLATGVNTLPGEGSSLVWAGYEYMGRTHEDSVVTTVTSEALGLVATTYWQDVKHKGLPCKMYTATNTITYSDQNGAWLVNLGDSIVFNKAVGNVVAGTLYYVYAAKYDSSTHLNTIQISAVPLDSPGAGVFALGADSTDNSQSWGSAPVSLLIANLPVPQALEETHDYPVTARYLLVADRRLYAGCLAYSGGVWQRPLDIAVSGENDYASWPETPATDSSGSPLEQDGELIGQPSPDAQAIVALTKWREEKVIPTAIDVHALIGENPQQGWRFFRQSVIGEVSSTLAVTRDGIVHVGAQSGDFEMMLLGSYYQMVSQGGSVPVSVGLVETTGLDWTKPHGAVAAGNAYIMFAWDANPERGPVGADYITPAACTMNAAPTNTVTSTAHGLWVGCAFRFMTAVGGVDPTATYWVCAVPDANTFQFSAERYHKTVPYSSTGVPVVITEGD